MNLAKTPVVIRCSLGAILLAALILAPFSNKAFTIDDPTFLRGAEQMLVDPLHPSAFEMVWMSAYKERASEVYPNTPVAYLLLVPAILAGGSEWVAHLTWFLLLVLGILGTVRLALRLGLSESQARAAAFLLAGTPCVLAMAGTAMPDVPAMAFGVLSAERLLAFKQESRWHQGLAFSFLLVLGIFCRPHLVLMTGAGSVLLWDDSSPGNAISKFKSWLFRLWPLVLALFLMLVTVRLIRDPLNPAAGAFQGPLHLSSTAMAARNLIAFLAHWAMVAPVTVPWLITRWRNLPYSFLLPLIAVIAPVVFITDSVLAWIFPLAVLSAFALLDILLDALRRYDLVQLFLFTWMLIPLAALPYVHLPSKYLVACAPAAALLLAPRLTKKLTGIAVLSGALIGILILSADATLAGAWRDGAARLIAPRVRAGEKVWFAGSWGYYWYAEKAGAQVLSKTPPLPRQGDIVVVNTSWIKDEMEVVPNFTELERHEISAPGGRIFGGYGRAGFYSNQFGYLPWTYGTEVLTRFIVLRVD